MSISVNYIIVKNYVINRTHGIQVSQEIKTISTRQSQIADFDPGFIPHGAGQQPMATPHMLSSLTPPVHNLLPMYATTKSTRMWANAQRDGRPAEYRRGPPVNAAKFG